MDSDGGEDIYVVGTVTKGSQQWVDRCHNQATLIEYLCIENVLTSKMVQCPTGCLDGKCLSCEDTDGGDNPYVFGSVSVGANLHKKDICSTIGDGKTLQEYYCLNETYIGMVKHICPSACVAGACI